MDRELKAPKSFESPKGTSVDLLLVVGEHSGDEHAAEMLLEMRRLNPELKVACLGGPKLKEAGAQLLYDLTAVSIVGFVEVLKHYRFFKTLFNATLDWIETYCPKHICFVDYPGFNLRLAKQLKERGLSQKGGGAIGVSYYIGPQVWAWKSKRRFEMETTLDNLSVIFPFEVECYSDTELPVDYVVHPFLKDSYQLPFYYDSEAPVLLLPGSRVEAVGRIFPTLLDGFERALAEDTSLEALVIYPSEQIKLELETILENRPAIKDSIKLSKKSETRIAARAALMSSGTMSLAVALSGIPGAIAYRMNPLSFKLGQWLVKIPFIGISNLLLDRELHPEFLQDAATPEALGATLMNALSETSKEHAKDGAEELRSLLNPKEALDASEWLLEKMR